MLGIHTFEAQLWVFIVEFYYGGGACVAASVFAVL